MALNSGEALLLPDQCVDLTYAFHAHSHPLSLAIVANLSHSLNVPLRP
jgi:hypothetical protein